MEQTKTFCDMCEKEMFFEKMSKIGSFRKVEIYKFFEFRNNKIYDYGDIDKTELSFCEECTDDIIKYITKKTNGSR